MVSSSKYIKHILYVYGPIEPGNYLRETITKLRQELRFVVTFLLDNMSLNCYVFVIFRRVRPGSLLRRWILFAVVRKQVTFSEY